jgi:hypothetical protein
MGDLGWNLDNKGCDNNLSNQSNNTNARQKEVHFKDKPYSIKW